MKHLQNIIYKRIVVDSEKETKELVVARLSV